MRYGKWQEHVSVDNQSFPAERVDSRYAERAGVREIYAVRGLPARFEKDLLVASQISDVPHTWRVHECSNETEVTPEIIRKAREALDFDIKHRGVHIISYAAKIVGTDELRFVAAGAIRDKLTPSFLDPQFPVVSRAIVAPSFRGRGLGSLIVEHRFKAVLRFFEKPPKAIHFGTESEKILHSLKRVEQDEGLRFVHIGVERYEASDGIHSVNDYLCFLPWYQKLLLEACARLERGGEPHFGTALQVFMEQGIEGVSGGDLATAFQALKLRAQVSAENRSALAALEELFAVKRAIGAEDPE